MFRHARAAFLALLVVTYAHAIPIGPFLTVMNAAKDNLAIAPGSFVRVFSKSTLPEDLSKIEIKLVAGERSYLLPAVEPPVKSANEVWAVIPADAPLGTASVVVSSWSWTFQIVAAAPGIFTRDYSGQGPAIALNTASAQIALTRAAVPGGEIALFVTGLGGAPSEDVSVEVGGQVARVLHAGPQGMPGLDQINFVVPKDAYLGCYVPVAVRVRGIFSNYGTLSINPDPAACAHPFGLTYSDLKKLDAGGTIFVAPFRAGEPQNKRNGAVAIWFSEVGSAGAFEIAGMQMPDSLYLSCASPETARWGSVGGSDLDAGAAMNLSGPGGVNFSLPRYIGGPYYLAEPPSSLASGTWQLSTPGGPDVQGFSLSFWLPPSSREVKAEHVGRDVVITWDPAGFLPSDVVSVWNDRFPPKGATCRARASDGRIVIPDSLGKELFLVASPHPSAQAPLPVERKDGGVIRTVAGYEILLGSVNVQ